jgi:hypothetical protein
MQVGLSLKQAQEFWLVTSRDRKVAKLGVDRDRQVVWVILDEMIDDDDRLEVLRLALSHAILYLRRRNVAQEGLGKFARPAHMPSVDSPSVSVAAMRFTSIADAVVNASEKEVRAGLAGWDIDIIDSAMIEGPGKDIQALAAKVARFSVSTRVLRGEKEVSCTFVITGNGIDLACWKYGSSNDPSHPMNHGKEPLVLVDGVTSSVIGRDYVVRSVQAPVTGTKMDWQRCKPPCASGKALYATLSIPRFRTAEGKKELEEFLRALLGQGDRYVGVQSFGR